MNKRINFIFNVLEGRNFKRVEAFKEAGYEVKVYGFDRGNAIQRDSVSVDILGSFPNSLPYLKRIGIIIKPLLRIFKSSRASDNELWYYDGLQMAIFCCLLNRNKKYIYEESDMTHLDIKYLWVRSLLESINKRIIKKSICSVFTSEGFLTYHYGLSNEYPINSIILPNKVHAGIINVPTVEPRKTNTEHLRFGFVGFIRYTSVYNFAHCIALSYPQHEFHFYGEFVNETEEKRYKSIMNFKNIFFHGKYKNPDDLSKIYSSIDVVIATYDVSSLNVQYAEPNKLYESIYFHTPIVVSSNTFLAMQVERYHNGWHVNALSDADICNLIETIHSQYSVVRNSIVPIPQSIAIDDTSLLVNSIERFIG